MIVSRSEQSHRLVVVEKSEPKQELEVVETRLCPLLSVVDFGLFLPVVLVESLDLYAFQP